MPIFYHQPAMNDSLVGKPSEVPERLFEFIWEYNKVGVCWQLLAIGVWGKVVEIWEINQYIY